jgi:glycosyltransferase involved in cell wall biosynthesis
MTASPVDAPMVSVITTFLNPGRFLSEAVASVLEQTWRSRELLLVDDGSTDGSSEWARSLAEREPSVRYIEHADHANLGMSASRNAGIAQARGTVIAFLDADDVFLPEKLDRQVTVLMARPDVDAVIAETLLWYGWTEKEEDISRDTVRTLRLAAGSYAPGELIPRLIQRAIRTPATCGVLVRRSTVERIGGFEPSFRTMYEDQAFFFKLFLHSRTLVMPEVFDRYRQHPDSCCVMAERTGDFSQDGGPSPARQRFLDWAADYLRTQNGGRSWSWYLVELERWLGHHPSLAARAHRHFLRAHAWMPRVTARDSSAAARIEITQD